MFSIIYGTAILWKTIAKTNCPIVMNLYIKFGSAAKLSPTVSGFFRQEEHTRLNSFLCLPLFQLVDHRNVSVQIMHNELSRRCKNQKEISPSKLPGHPSVPPLVRKRLLLEQKKKLEDEKQRKLILGERRKEREEYIKEVKEMIKKS